MKGFRFLVDSKTARVSATYAKKKNITTDEAIKEFLASATYRGLNVAETGLYLEVFEYVYDMFLEEKGEHENETDVAN
jgi:hypothetical protein